jgi:hypothetical protein
MQPAAIFIALFVSISIAISLPFLFLGKRYAAAQEKARACRLTGAKRNARLLSFNVESKLRTSVLKSEQRIPTG